MKELRFLKYLHNSLPPFVDSVNYINITGRKTPRYYRVNTFVLNWIVLLILWIPPGGLNFVSSVTIPCTDRQMDRPISENQ